MYLAALALAVGRRDSLEGAGTLGRGGERSQRSQDRAARKIHVAGVHVLFIPDLPSNIRLCQKIRSL